MIQNQYVIYLWMHQVMEWDVCLQEDVKGFLYPVAYHSKNLKDYEKIMQLMN